MRISFLKWTFIVGKYAKSVLIIVISAILLIAGGYIFAMQGNEAEAITITEGSAAGQTEASAGDVAKNQSGGDSRVGNGAGSQSGGKAEGQSGGDAGDRGGGHAGGDGVQGEARQPNDGSGIIDDNPDLLKIHVYVTGAVNKPGVYTLEKYSMVVDAVEMAGGLTAEADEERINMVYKLENNAMLNILRKIDDASVKDDEEQPGEVPPDDNLYGDGLIISNDYGGPLIELKEIQSGAEINSKNADLININTAPKELLSTLSGIGAATADKIISYREKNNGFKTIEDLMKVSGIKQAKFDAIKDLISAD